MFGLIKTRGILLNMEFRVFTNKATGEVVDMTLVRYSVPGQVDETFKGSIILECYTTGEAFAKLDKLLGKDCEIVISQKPTDNGSKYVLVSVNDIELKKNK